MTKHRQAFPKLFSWILLNIFLPLVPLAIGVFVIFMRGNTNVGKLLDSTEFFLLSFTILAATVYDYFNSQIEAKVDWRVAIALQFLSRIIIPLLIFYSGAIFTTVYIDKNITPLGLQKPLLVRVAGYSAIGISLLCVSLQTMILLNDT